MFLCQILISVVTISLDLDGDFDIQQTNNLGFGKANNIGIKKALDLGVDYVFLLNQDAYLVGDTIKDLIMIHQSNLDYGILSPIHLNGKGNKLDRNFSYYLSYDKNKHFYSDFILFYKLNAKVIGFSL